MTNPDSWRSLAEQFQAAQSNLGDSLRAGWQHNVDTLEDHWTLDGDRALQMRFEALAIRAAVLLPDKRSHNLRDAWLEALRRDGHGFKRGASSSTEDRTGNKTSDVFGEIDFLFQTSTDFCRRMESEALQAEYDAAQLKRTRELEHARKLAEIKRPETPAGATSGSPLLHQESAADSVTFTASEDYCSIVAGKTTYTLTKLAGQIVKVLHEAAMQNGRVVSGQEIRRKTHCGKIWDAFRRRDGRKFWERFVEKPNRDIFALRLPEQHSQRGKTRKQP